MRKRTRASSRVVLGSLAPELILVLLEVVEAPQHMICSLIELDTDGAILLRQDGRASWASFHGSRTADASSPWSSSEWAQGITFLNGIAWGRHHYQVRQPPPDHVF